MILPFKTHVKGKPTHFVEKILACKMDEYRKVFIPKLHTIRRGSRWKAGMTIHMATGVRTKKYFRFNGDGIGLDKCISTQSIKIVWDQVNGHNFNSSSAINQNGRLVGVWIDGVIASYPVVAKLANNDGFDGVDSFFDWFCHDFDGQIIHWTKFRY